MTQDSLFLPSPTYEPSTKLAVAETSLGPDPHNWSQEILQELFKQAPYVSDFQPTVVLQRVDSERGLGFGHIELKNQTESQAPSGSLENQALQVRVARIPLIIKEARLSPLDVIITDTNKMVPMTERRIRQALFRPQIFDLTARRPGDPSLLGALFPPFRQNFGMTGTGAMVSDGGLPKFGQLIEVILPTIQEDHFNKCAQVIQDNFQAFQNNPACRPVLAKLAEYQGPGSSTPSSVEKDWSVVQLGRSGVFSGTYEIKRAHYAAWEPTLSRVSRGEMFKLAGPELMNEIDQGGEVTLAVGPELLEENMPEQDKPEIVQEFGVYKVQDKSGKHLVGFVLPNLVDPEGQAVPMSLFTNGMENALQGEIVGIKIAEGTNLIAGKPRPGYGCFFRTLPNGKVQAMTPMMLEGGVKDQGGDGWIAKDLNMGSITVRLQEGIKVPSMVDTTCLVPADSKWLPMDQDKAVALVDKPEAMSKEASKLPEVTLRASSSGFVSLHGAPLAKLAHEDREGLTLGEAIFTLAGMGVHPSLAQTKIAQSLGGLCPVQVQVLHSVTPRNEVGAFRAFAKQAFDQKLAKYNRDLVKEAAWAPDPDSADVLLSLGFLNPENLDVFVRSLPKMHEVQNTLCELLVASRLGLKELPSFALERSVRSLEETIEGLETLSFAMA